MADRTHSTRAPQSIASRLAFRSVAGWADRPQDRTRVSFRGPELGIASRYISVCFSLSPPLPSIDPAASAAIRNTPSTGRRCSSRWLASSSSVTFILTRYRQPRLAECRTSVKWNPTLATSSQCPGPGLGGQSGSCLLELQISKVSNPVRTHRLVRIWTGRPPPQPVSHSLAESPLWSCLCREVTTLPAFQNDRWNLCLALHLTSAVVRVSAKWSSDARSRELRALNLTRSLRHAFFRGACQSAFDQTLRTLWASRATDSKRERTGSAIGPHPVRG